MKPTKNNQFRYETSSGYTYGFFNIYQGRNGKIFIQICNSVTALTPEQISELNISVYELKDFDYDHYVNSMLGITVSE